VRYDEWLSSGDFATSASGHRVFWRARGSGPQTVLFLHGYPTSSFDWASTIASLGDEFRCVTFDFLGFGASAKPRIRYRYALQLGALEAVVRAANIDEAVVVAHDYGASVGQELLARAREKRAPFLLRGAVFLNGGLDSALHRALFVQKLLASDVGPWIAPLLLHRRTFERSLRRILAKPERVDFGELWAIACRDDGHRLLPRLLHYMAERREQRARWTGILAETEVPLAFGWGAADPVSGAHVLSWVRRTCPKAEFLELPDVGHYPQLEAQERIGPWLKATISRWFR
jgi:pimeloyl-ACP methyl ester carboxylesterase